MDMTLCENDDCPVRLRFFRFTAKPSGVQSFARFKNEVLSGCTEFLTNDDEIYEQEKKAWTRYVIGTLRASENIDLDEAIELARNEWAKETASRLNRR